MSGYEPKPRCPRRLSEMKDVKARFTDSGSVELTVKLSYDPWCCDGGHEIVDALAALDKALSHAHECESAWRTMEDIHAEMDGETKLGQ